MDRPPSARYLYPAVLIYSTVLFSTYTPRGLLVINLLRQKICGQFEAFDDDGGFNCDEDEVSIQSSYLSMWIGLAMALPSILVSGPLGVVANCYGRLLPPAIASTGALINCVLIACVAQYKWKAEWLILASFIEGIAGTYTCFLMGTSSYVSDCNQLDGAALTETERVERFSFVEASLSVGILIGPVCGSIISDVVGYPLFFLGAAALLCGLVAYITWYIPESLPPNVKAAAAYPSEDSSAPSAGWLKSMWSAFMLAFATRPFRQAQPPLLSSGSATNNDNDYKELSGDRSSPRVSAIHLSHVSLAFMMSFGSNNSLTGLFILYTTRVWKWDSVAIGTYVSAMGGAGTFGLLFSRRIFKWVRARDLPDLHMMLAGAGGE